MPTVPASSLICTPIFTNRQHFKQVTGIDAPPADLSRPWKKWSELCGTDAFTYLTLVGTGKAAKLVQVTITGYEAAVLNLPDVGPGGVGTEVSPPYRPLLEYEYFDDGPQGMGTVVKDTRDEVSKPHTLDQLYDLVQQLFAYVKLHLPASTVEKQHIMWEYWELAKDARDNSDTCGVSPFLLDRSNIPTPRAKRALKHKEIKNGTH